MAGNRKVYSDRDEQALMTHIWSNELADDPEAFIRFAFPWGVPNTPLADFKGAKAWQIKILKKIKAHIQEQKKNKLNKLDLSTLKLARASGRGIGVVDS